MIYWYDDLVHRMTKVGSRNEFRPDSAFGLMTRPERNESFSILGSLVCLEKAWWILSPARLFSRRLHVFTTAHSTEVVLLAGSHRF